MLKNLTKKTALNSDCSKSNYSCQRSIY